MIGLDPIGRIEGQCGRELILELPPPRAKIKSCAILLASILSETVAK